MSTLGPVSSPAPRPGTEAQRPRPSVLRPDIPATTPAERARLHRQAVWLMLLCTLLWSLAGVFTRKLQSAESFELAFWRSLACGLAVAGVLIGQHGRGWTAKVTESGWPGLVSGLMWAVMFTCFMVALGRTSVANTLVVMSVAPLLAALLARAVLKEPVLPRTWLAILIAGTGIVWMVRDQLSTYGLAGMAIAFAVPLASAINIVSLKRAGAHVDLVPAVLIGAAIACVATLPLAWPLAATMRDLLILAGLGVFQLALPCMLMVRAAHHLAPHEIALLGLLEIVFGPLWAWIGAGERPAAATLQGGALVLTALLVNELVALRGRRIRPA